SEWTHPEDERASVHNVFVLGSRVYCSWYTAGLEVLDNSNPELPQRIANYDTYPADAPPPFNGAWGVYPYLPSGTVLVSDISTGLYVFRVDPALGKVRLRVIDAATGDPLSAEVRFPEEPLDPRLRGNTGPDGELELLLTPGTQRAFVSAFGHASSEVSLQVVRDQELEAQVQLAPLASGALSGVVRVLDEGGTGEPVAGVRVRVLGTPLETRTSEAGAFDFPSIPEGDWTVELRRFGYRTEPVPVEIAAGELRDRVFEIAPAYFADDFETDRGWTVGDPQDDAVSGIWVRADPISDGGLSAPEDDASEEGTFAFVTGNGGGGVGADDVDGGQTTLFSPSFDLSQTFQPWLVFMLWYESSDDFDPNADPFTVDASTDGGVRWT